MSVQMCCLLVKRQVGTKHFTYLTLATALLPQPTEGKREAERALVIFPSS